MALYIHPENQKLLWYAIQTSPSFNQEEDNTEWFKSIISEFYAKCPPDISSDKLKEMNMDTIIYMVRDLKRIQAMNDSSHKNETNLDGLSVPTWSVDTGNEPKLQDTKRPDSVRDSRPETSLLPAPVQFRENLPLHQIVQLPSTHLRPAASQLPANLPMRPQDKLAPASVHIDVHDWTGAGDVNTSFTSWDDTKKYFNSRSFESNTSSTGHGALVPAYEVNRPNRDDLNHYSLGNLNPLYTPIITKCLNIDTRFRDNLYTTSSTNFTFNLPIPMKKVISMQLTAYELPVTFYGISKSYGNNYMYINCYFQYPTMASESIQQKEIIIPDGNYSASDLIDLINNQLRPLNPDGSLVNTALDGTNNDSIFNCVQFSFDITTSGSGSAKITLGLNDPPNFASSTYISGLEMDFTLDINGNPDTTSITSKLGWNLGFIQPQYLDAKTYTADTLPEPASLRYVYLAIDDFNNNVNNSFVAAFNKYILSNNILARIPVNAQYFNILMENDLSQHTEPRKYFGPVDINKLQIQLLDDHGRILDINKANYSLCLTFKMINE